MDPQRDSRLAGSWEWLRFAAALPARPVPVLSQTAGQKLFTGRCLLRGFALLNTGGAGANAAFYDGTDANGLSAGVYHIGTGIGAYGPLADGPLLLEVGCFYVAGGASVSGAVFITPLHVDFRVTPPGE